MPEAANHTSPAPSAPAVPYAPQAAPAPGGPFWLVFCVMACSAFAALLGRLAHAPHSSSPQYPDTPGDLSADSPFAFLLHLVAIDWFRRSRSAPATPEQLLRRSRLARAVFSQPLAPVVPCDRPGQSPTPGTFAPAFASQLAASAATPLSLTPTSFLNAYLASLSTPSRPALSSRNQALLIDAYTDTPVIEYSAFRIPNSALVYSAFLIPHSAFPRAPV